MEAAEPQPVRTFRLSPDVEPHPAAPGAVAVSEPHALITRTRTQRPMGTNAMANGHQRRPTRRAVPSRGVEASLHPSPSSPPNPSSARQQPAGREDGCVSLSLRLAP